MVASLPDFSQLDVSGVKRGIDDVPHSDKLTQNNVKAKLRGGAVLYSGFNPGSFGILSHSALSVDSEVAQLIRDRRLYKPDAQGSYNNVYFAQSLPPILYRHYNGSSWVAIRQSNADLGEEEIEAAYEEVFITMFAADKGLAPMVLATYVIQTKYRQRLVVITAKGTALNDYLDQVSAMARHEIARRAIDLCGRCAEHGLLLLDIKPGNMIYLRPKVFMIDIDPTFTSRVDKMDEQCARFLMVLLLAVNIRCSFRYKEMTAALNDELLQKINTKCGNDFLAMLIRFHEGRWEIGNPADGLQWSKIPTAQITHPTNWAVQAVYILMWYLFNDNEYKTAKSVCLDKKEVFSLQVELSLVGQLLAWLQRCHKSSTFG